MSGQLHAPAALPPENIPPVPIVCKTIVYFRLNLRKRVMCMVLLMINLLQRHSEMKTWIPYTGVLPYKQPESPVADKDCGHDFGFCIFTVLFRKIIRHIHRLAFHTGLVFLMFFFNCAPRHRMGVEIVTASIVQTQLQIIVINISKHPVATNCFP
jgi:hypothetical protein